jgi:CheY-like chemotaxis protein
VPAIAISGSVYRDDVERCLAAGFTGHLPKPFDEEGLVSAIDEVMRVAQSESPSVGNGGVPAPVPARLR